MKKFKIITLFLTLIALAGCDQDKKQDWDDNDTCGENYVTSNPCSNYQHHSSILPIYFYWWWVMNMNRGYYHYHYSPYVSRPVVTSNFRGNSRNSSFRITTTTASHTESHSSSRSSSHITHFGGGGRK